MVTLTQRARRLFVVALLLTASCQGDEVIERKRRSSDLKALSELKGRPLALEPIGAREQCPLSEATHLKGIPAEAGLGQGPVYSVFPGIPRLLDLFRTHRTSESDPWTAEILWVSTRAYRGPGLIRGRRLDGAGRVNFVVGEESTSQLLLPTGDWSLDVQRPKVWSPDDIQPAQGWRVTSTTVAIERGGCYGFQVDTLKGSYSIVFAAMPQPAADAR